MRAGLASEQLERDQALEAADLERRQARAVEQRGVPLSHGEHDRHRIREQPANGEQERLGAGRVKPVGVVDERQHRTLLGVGGEQAQRRSADREAVRATAWPQRERAPERSGLRGRHAFERPEGGAQELQQPRERHGRL